MTQRVNQGAVVENKPGQLPLFLDMGGTTGGERESDPHHTVVAIVRDPTTWGTITESEVTWAYWLHEDIVNYWSWRSQFPVRDELVHTEATQWRVMGSGA